MLETDAKEEIAVSIQQNLMMFWVTHKNHKSNQNHKVKKKLRAK
jgi:hypothetical protein